MLFISDPTLTTGNVAEVMELLNNWDSLGVICFFVSATQFDRIQWKCSSKKEILNECASYYVHCHPQPSWTQLANCLYKKDEFAAVEKLKPFLPLRGKYQVISYAGMNHALQACAVCLLSWFT